MKEVENTTFPYQLGFPWWSFHIQMYVVESSLKGTTATSGFDWFGRYTISSDMVGQ